MFIDITKSNFKNFDFYLDFMKKSSQSEFLLSQIPFYYAVESFPRALCFLGYLIPGSLERLNIVENIFEEHGKGDVNSFHILTYKQYLDSLGSHELFKNPFVQEWINSWFQDNDIFLCALRLSAIEYMYAPISFAISEHLETLPLLCEQNHYGKHAVIDWEHGKELLNVAMYFRGERTDEEIIQLFTLYQNDFLDVFRSMVVLTKKDIKSISSEKISFYYLREDCNISNIEEACNIVSICSGGESIINLLSKDNKKDIIAIDMNNYQLNLTQDKIHKIKNKEKRETFLEGKFEKMFFHLRERLPHKDLEYFKMNNYIDYSKIKFITDDIFNKDVLISIFGENAVRYSSESFSEHFANIFSQDIISDFDKMNKRNIFLNEQFIYPESLKLEKHNVRFINCDLYKENTFKNISFNNGRMADVIDVSNIGDWMHITRLEELIKDIYTALNPGGSIIIRKLLGDYNLRNMLNKYGFSTINKSDSFYSETIQGIK